MPHSTREKLYVNDGALEPVETARLRASSPTLPLEELRSRFQADGYLYLKGLLPREDVLRAREKYFEFLSPSGVLKDGTTPRQGIFDSAKDAARFPGIGVGRVDVIAGPEDQATDFVSLALDAHGQEWYAKDLCKHPVMLEFMARFTGWNEATQPLERTLLRNNIPDTKAIGVHYDQIFLRYGEPTSITVWVPIGDISLNGGGLIYLENGHTLGKDFEDEFTEKAKATGLTDEEAKSAFNANMLDSGVLTEGPAGFGRTHNRRWLVTDYEAGDVVLHNTYMIHASTVNHDPDNVIRLATDLRFVNSSRPWDERWSNQFRVGDGV
ncbi:uncharacterized protein DNG_05950 [Cephalotrichum gorgonifer]|uniref:Phytanoyl-CoA hydroxylase n=1 Tax=Cephalotrichum gorgonifer TaxID=2041049 RepID=A0AAE8SW00_9PEZI|nr:uncharacterized protein DNG_05950 [Cephalotrichum gorgonifer]